MKRRSHGKSTYPMEVLNTCCRKQCLHANREIVLLNRHEFKDETQLKKATIQIG